MTRRSYASPLRAAQADGTRERILEAFAEQLAEAKEEFSIPRVAERAGVSVRTVYHYFPNREEQITSLAAWLDAKLVNDDPGPSGPDDLPAYAERMAAAFWASEPLMRAQLASGVASEVRARRRKRRFKAIDRAVAALGTSPAEARIAAALVKALVDGQVGLTLTDKLGLTRAETVVACRWVVEVVVRALARGDVPHPVPSR